MLSVEIRKCRTIFPNVKEHLLKNKTHSHSRMGMLGDGDRDCFTAPRLFRWQSIVDDTYTTTGFDLAQRSSSLERCSKVIVDGRFSDVSPFVSNRKVILLFDWKNKMRDQEPSNN